MVVGKGISWLSSRPQPLLILLHRFNLCMIGVKYWHIIWTTSLLFDAKHWNFNGIFVMEYWNFNGFVWADTMPNVQVYLYILLVLMDSIWIISITQFWHGTKAYYPIAHSLLYCVRSLFISLVQHFALFVL